MLVFKYLEDFLPSRPVDDFVFTVFDKHSNEELIWDILDVLDEINRDRTADWIDYTKDNWFDGWSEWCEDDAYTILLIEDRGDKVYRPFLSMHNTKKNNMSYEPKYIEQPVVSVHNSSEEGHMLVIHSHINQKGKMILSKDEASLLLLELYKFIQNN